MHFLMKRTMARVTASGFVHICNNSDPETVRAQPSYCLGAVTSTCVKSSLSDQEISAWRLDGADNYTVRSVLVDTCCSRGMGPLPATRNVQDEQGLKSLHNAIIVKRTRRQLTGMLMNYAEDFCLAAQRKDVIELLKAAYGSLSKGDDHDNLRKFRPLSDYCLMTWAKITDEAGLLSGLLGNILHKDDFLDSLRDLFRKYSIKDRFKNSETFRESLRASIDGLAKSATCKQERSLSLYHVAC